MLQVEERLALLREMLESVNPNLIMVELDPHFELVRSNAPDYDMWRMYFTYAAPPEGFSEPDHAFPEPAAPWVFTNTLGMTWMSASQMSVELMSAVQPAFSRAALTMYTPS